MTFVIRDDLKLALPELDGTWLGLYKCQLPSRCFVRLWSHPVLEGDVTIWETRTNTKRGSPFLKYFFMITRSRVDTWILCGSY